MTDIGGTFSGGLAARYRRATLRPTRSALVTLFVLTDIAVVTACVHLVDLIYHRVAFDEGAFDSDMIGISLLVSVLFSIFQLIGGAYTVQSYLNPTGSYRRTLLNWLMVAFIVAWVGFLMKVTGEFSRVALTGSFLVGAISVVLVRALVAQLLRQGMARGIIALRKAYVICAGVPVVRRELLAEAARNGVGIAGLSVLPAQALEGDGFAGRCAATVNEVLAAYQRSAFDEVYLFLPWERRGPLRQFAATLGRIPLPVFLFADAEFGRLIQAPALSVGRFKAFQVQGAPLSPLELATKRVLDIVLSSAGLVVLAPLLLAVAAAIFWTSGGPIFFRQERQGIAGRLFTIYKFRTMNVCENGATVTQATANDPRITPLGAVLRRTSIDELPQLFNVLRGDMSIVGPRPHAVAHDQHYSHLIALYSHRQLVKPGLTGWAQAHGFRGETSEIGSMNDRILFDLWYINNWNIVLDIRIIIRTAVKMLFDKAAY